MNRHTALITLCLAGLYLAAAGAAPAAPKNKTGKHAAGKGGMRTVEATGGVRLVPKQSGHCRALAPADWVIVADAQGRGTDLVSPDKRLYAGWAILAIPGVLLSSPAYRDPETAMKTVADSTLRMVGDNSGIRFTSPQKNFDAGGYFKYRSAASAGRKGIVVYHVYPSPPGVGGFIVSEYTAWTVKDLWARKGALAVNVAASIRCTVMLAPSGGGTGGGSASKRPDTSTYNKELGMEYAHSPSTGENYWVSPSTSYNENGPQGAGYYRQSGNSYEKLAPGRSD